MNKKMIKSDSIDDFRNADEYWKHKYYDSEKELKALKEFNNTLRLAFKRLF